MFPPKTPPTPQGRPSTPAPYIRHGGSPQGAKAVTYGKAAKVGAVRHAVQNHLIPAPSSCRCFLVVFMQLSEGEGGAAKPTFEWVCSPVIWWGWTTQSRNSLGVVSTTKARPVLPIYRVFLMRLASPKVFLMILSFGGFLKKILENKGVCLLLRWKSQTRKRVSCSGC